MHNSPPTYPKSCYYNVAGNIIWEDEDDTKTITTIKSESDKPEDYDEPYDLFNENESNVSLRPAPQIEWHGFRSADIRLSDDEDNDEFNPYGHQSDEYVNIRNNTDIGYRYDEDIDSFVDLENNAARTDAAGTDAAATDDAELQTPQSIQFSHSDYFKEQDSKYRLYNDPSTEYKNYIQHHTEQKPYNLRPRQPQYGSGYGSSYGSHSYDGYNSYANGTNKDREYGERYSHIYNRPIGSQYTNDRYTSPYDGRQYINYNDWQARQASQANQANRYSPPTYTPTYQSFYINVSTLLTQDNVKPLIAEQMDARPDNVSKNKADYNIRDMSPTIKEALWGCAENKDATETHIHRSIATVHNQRNICNIVQSYVGDQHDVQLYLPLALNQNIYAQIA